MSKKLNGISENHHLTMNKNPFFQVLKVKNFQKLWGSQILSQITLNLINFVIILRIFEASHSTVAVSLVWIFYAIPAILLGPFSGTIVDLVEKRKALIWTNFSQAVIVLCYLLIKQKIWPIYTIVFLYSLVNQLYIPAEASTLPGVVPKKLYPSANGIFMFTMYGTFLVGFSLAGPLVRLVGKEMPFFFSSLLLGLAAVSVALLPSGMRGERKGVRGIQEFWDKVKDGYLFIKEETAVLFPLILIVLSQIIVGILAVLIPSFATEILSIDLLDAGLVLVSPAGLGALIGAQGVVWALKRIRKKKVISFGLFLATLGLLCFSLIIPNLPFFKTPIAIIAAWLLGISFVSLIIPTQTLIQETTPKEFRGRVFGVLGFMITVAAILPVLLTATIADLLGVTWIMFIISLVIGIIAVYSLGEPYAKFAQRKI
jgi:MFS family permease